MKNKLLLLITAVALLITPFIGKAFNDGDLVSDKGTIYSIEYGLKRPFVSLKVFKGLGYKLNNVKKQDTSSIPIGPNILSSQLRHPRGTVVSSKKTLFFMGKDFRYPYPSADIFLSWGVKFNEVVPANGADLRVPTGAVVQAKGQSVQPIVTQPVVTQPNPTQPPTQNSNAYDTASLAAKNIFILNDDGTIIGQNDSVNVSSAISNFYKAHPDKDIYDFISIFNTFTDSTQPHLHYQVKNSVEGIGLGIFDASSQFGNPKNLLGVNYMNSSYTSPGQTSPSLLQANFSVLTHEIVHQWAMFIGDRISCGVDCASGWKFKADDAWHFSRWANTKFTRNGQMLSDVNGGFAWTDNGNGTYTVGDSVTQGFSPLTLYLMGLLPASSFSGFSFIQPTTNDYNLTTVTGSLKTLSLSDLVRQYGVRTPDYSSSQKDFKMAYVILAHKGEQPTKDQLDAINYIADNYPKQWSIETNGASTINK